MLKGHTTNCNASASGISPVLLSRRVLSVMVVCLLTLSAHAIVIRHDLTDASGYEVDESRYPQIFTLHYHDDKRTCIGNLIDPQWALTAAHCLEETPILDTLNEQNAWELSINGAVYNIAEFTMHPLYPEAEVVESVDLALIKLDRPVPDVVPMSLYRETDELNKVLQFLGWGYTGDGNVGRQYNDGKFRRAFNVVVEANKWLRFRFDDPRQQSHSTLPLEGVPALGDSGGPALIERENSLLLVGIALGELNDPQQVDINQGKYGAIELYERISNHTEWIDDIISRDVKPGT